MANSLNIFSCREADGSPVGGEYMRILTSDLDASVNRLREGKKRFTQLFGDCKEVEGFTLVPAKYRITVGKLVKNNKHGFVMDPDGVDHPLSSKVPTYMRFAYKGMLEDYEDVCLVADFTDIVTSMRAVRNLVLRINQGLNEGGLLKQESQIK